MVYINKGDHDNPHGFPEAESQGSQDNVHHDHAHIDIPPKMPEEIKKLEYICGIAWNTQHPGCTVAALLLSF